MAPLHNILELELPRGHYGIPLPILQAQMEMGWLTKMILTLTADKEPTT